MTDDLQAAKQRLVWVTRRMSTIVTDRSDSFTRLEQECSADIARMMSALTQLREQYRDAEQQIDSHREAIAQIDARLKRLGIAVELYRFKDLIAKTAALQSGKALPKKKKVNISAYARRVEQKIKWLMYYRKGYENDIVRLRSLMKRGIDAQEQNLVRAIERQQARLIDARNNRTDNGLVEWQQLETERAQLRTATRNSRAARPVAPDRIKQEFAELAKLFSVETLRAILKGN